MNLVSRVGIEPTTPCLRGRCSNRLSYRPKFLTTSIIAQIPELLRGIFHEICYIIYIWLIKICPSLKINIKNQNQLLRLSSASSPPVLSSAPVFFSPSTAIKPSLRSPQMRFQRPNYPKVSAAANSASTKTLTRLRSIIISAAAIPSIAICAC